MSGVISMNPPVVGAALRQLEQIRAQISISLWSGSRTLASVDMGDWYSKTFAFIQNVDDHTDKGRRDLQETFTNVMLADMSLCSYDFAQFIGIPIGDLRIDQILEALPQVALKEVRDAINAGDDLGMRESELDSVYDTLSGMSDKDRAFVLTQLTDEENTRLFHNVHDYGFWSDDWSEAKRVDFYDLYQCLPTAEKSRIGQFSPIAYLSTLATAEAATVDDQSAAGALEALRTSVGFKLASFDQRVALLSQAGNYPVEESISNLSRLVSKDWFRSFTVDDSQRSAKLVAFLSQYLEGDVTIIKNTLESFLGPQAPYRFDWNATGINKYGSADDGAFSFNRRFLDPGNEMLTDSIPDGIDEDDTNHMVTHTVAHEVNHLRNNVGVGRTFDYFMDEYRAYYVGCMAQDGVPPSRDAVWGRVNNFVTANGSYDDISDALADPIEGPKIAAFLSSMIGEPVSAAEIPAKWQELRPLPEPQAGTPVAATPPVPGTNGSNNMTNHG